MLTGVRRHDPLAQVPDARRAAAGASIVPANETDQLTVLRGAR